SLKFTPRHGQTCFTPHHATPCARPSPFNRIPLSTKPPAGGVFWFSSNFKLLFAAYSANWPIQTVSLVGLN
ncbi:hypothetical protein RA264_28710, partial [Pseudomonas syringae pv. tagetis]|uniref:hypothetical protein n=1 Tax=Pseudomonas syringae group genomosp. 7 TaxID=251699 RepID=UPI00377028A5